MTAEGSAKARALGGGPVERIPYTDPSVWELIFMMVILKIPIAYLCFVVYWAVKAEPKPPEPVRAATPADGPEPRAPWSPQPARRGRGAGLSAARSGRAGQRCHGERPAAGRVSE